MKVRFNAGIEYDNKLVLSSIDINGLWIYDLLQKKIVAYKRFEKERKSFAIHRKAFLYNNEAWFLPQNGEYIAIVNLCNYEISYMEMKYMNRNMKGIEMLNSKVYDGGIIEERYLYVVPSGIDTVNIIDLKEKEIITTRCIEEDVLAHAFYWGNVLYLYGMEGKLKKMDITTGEIESVDLINNIDQEATYGEAVVDTKHAIAYIGPGKNNSFITCVDLKKNKKYEILLGETIQTEYAKCIGDRIWFWGCTVNKVIIYDLNTKEIEIRRLHDNNNAVYVFIDSKHDNMVLVRDDQRLYRYGYDVDDIQQVNINIEFNDIQKIFQGNKDEKIWDILEVVEGGIIHEEDIPLQYYLDNF